MQSRLLMVAFAALLGWKRVLSCQSQYGDEYLFRPNLHLYSTAQGTNREITRVADLYH